MFPRICITTLCLERYEETIPEEFRLQFPFSIPLTLGMVKTCMAACLCLHTSIAIM